MAIDFSYSGRLPCFLRHLNDLVSRWRLVHIVVFFLKGYVAFVSQPPGPSLFAVVAVVVLVASVVAVVAVAAEVRRDSLADSVHFEIGTS